MRAGFISNMAAPRKDYFEAIIQLRNTSKDVLSCVRNAIKRRAGGVAVAKELHLKNGVDIYLSSQRYASTIGKLLKKSFKNGQMIESRQLYGMNRQSSRIMYRRTILFKLPIDTQQEPDAEHRAADDE